MIVTPSGTAAVVIWKFDDDGTAHARFWVVDEEPADELASELGSPLGEVVMSASQAVDARAAIATQGFAMFKASDE